MKNVRGGAIFDAGTLLATLMGLMMGIMMAMALTPNIQAVAKARVVGRKVFDVIDRVPLIKDKEDAITSYTLDDKITFKDVSFRYPTAPENVGNVLEKANFSIKAGTTTAIVGPSGSGKSTII